MNQFDIYVINLDKDTDRLKQITYNLSPNLFTRIPGVYGNALNTNEYNEILYTSKHLLPKSAIGCAMSHRKAIQTFMNTSNKPYALILEDDAVPLTKHYMEEVADAIKNAPSDWNIIKLDYIPKYNIPYYHQLFTLQTTAYVINKPGAEKLLRQPIIYHIDVDMNFYDLKMYNNPKVLFDQNWDENNHSNNRAYSLYNPLNSIHEGINFKAVRILGIEYTAADLILYLIILILIIVLWVHRVDKYVVKLLRFPKFTVK